MVIAGDIRRQIYVYLGCPPFMADIGTVDSIFSMVILHICMSLLESTLLSFCKPQSKLDLPTLRQGSRERKYATEQIKNMTLARI